MGLMGPVHSVRIALFRRTDCSHVKIHSLRRFLLRIAVFLTGAAIPSRTLGQAQPVFHFSKQVNVGDNVLPPGDYVITSLDIKNSGAVVTFATRGRQPRSDSARDFVLSDDAPSANGGLFTIHNPQNQTVPYAKAQMIYLSACRVVEQEYSRTERLRPRLTLLLGAAKDQVYYPNHEIQLKKWDEYRFAQGVVTLAVADMFPEDKKSTLANLALLAAESTVDVREFKSSRARLGAGPRN